MISTAIVSITGSDIIKESKSISPTVLLPQQLGSAYHVKKVSWHLLIVLFLCSEIYTYQMSWIAMTMHQFHLSCRVIPLFFQGSPCHSNRPPCSQENKDKIWLLLNVFSCCKDWEFLSHWDFDSLCSGFLVCRREAEELKFESGSHTFPDHRAFQDQTPHSSEPQFATAWFNLLLRAL